MSFDIEKVRQDFPILHQKVYGKPIVYLDNGATTQKPKSVIETVSRFYSLQNSNIHRGVHYLSNEATKIYEGARETVRDFINAKKTSEIVFTHGTTDSINMIAFSFGEAFINEGDEILVTETEHHSNIVPWQMMARRKNAKLIPIPVFDNGEFDFEAFRKLLNHKVKLVSVSQVSNAFGTIFPIDQIIKETHAAGAYIMVDGAQGIQHQITDVQKSDMDFYAFSGHKIYAETGVGVLYGKEELLEKLPPAQGGGDMIKTVSFDKTEYAELPLKFEAGTANYVAAVSLGEAINYMQSLGLENIHRHEAEVMRYATKSLSEISGLTIYGTSAQKAAAISFLLDDIHHYDTGMMLDKEGIAVRTGTHCAEPGMQRMGIRGTVRPGFALYNTKEEVDALVEGIEKVKKLFS
jgi:cysteine desulfurase / selenocysteine lyase